MKNIIFMLSAVLLLHFSVNAKGNYGAAGCGPGAMVVGADGNQFVAAFVNDGFLLANISNALMPGSPLGTVGGVIASIKTFAISSGTSNCSDDGIALGDKEKEQFLAANYESVSQEAAKGEGEYLTAFGYLMGCSGSSTIIFQNRVQQNYISIFSETNAEPSQVINEVHKLITTDETLSQICAEGRV